MNEKESIQLYYIIIVIIILFCLFNHSKQKYINPTYAKRDN